MTWNHRVLLTEEQGEKFYCIHEVHYYKDGRIAGWTADPIAVCSDSPEGLRWQLDKMLECLSKPILRPVGDALIEETSASLMVGPLIFIT